MPEPAQNDPQTTIVEGAPGSISPEARAIAAMAKPSTETAPPEPAAPPPEGAPPPEAAPPDQQLARLHGQHARMEQQFRQAQQVNKQMEQRLAAFEAHEQEWKDDPYAAAQKRGLDPREWVANQLGMEEPLPEDKADAALNRLEELEQREQEREQEEQQVASQTRFAELRGHVGKFLEDNEFGAVRASPAAVQKLTADVRQMEVDGAFAGMEPDRVNETLSQMTQKMDDSLRHEVAQYLQAPGALKALLKDEHIAKVIRESLGTPQPSAGTPPTAGGARTSPRTIDNQMASEPGSRELPNTGNAPVSPMDRERAAAVALERAFARKKAG